MAPTNTLAALAATALLGASALAATPTPACCAGSPTTPSSKALSQSISIEQRPGQAPVVILNGHPIDDDNIELAPDGRLLINDGQGNSIDLLAGMGMATIGSPFDTASRQVDVRPVIGVRLQPVSPALASHLGLAPHTGLLVSDLHDTMPAAAAGMQQWDVITSVDGRPVASPNELSATLARSGPDAGVAIECIRGGTATTVTVAPMLAEVPVDAPTLRPDGRSMQAMMDQVMRELDHQFPGDLHRHMQAIQPPSGPSVQRERTPLDQVDHRNDI